MAEWSKVLPSMASCLSPLRRFELRPAGACKEIVSDLGLGGGFRRFPVVLKSAIWGTEMTIIAIPNPVCEEIHWISSVGI